MDNTVNVNITASDNTGAAFASLQKGIGGVETAAQSVTEKIAGLEETFSGMAIGGGIAFAAVTAALGLSVKGAIEAESAQIRLATILQTSTGATDAQVRALTEQAQALEKLGVVSAEGVMTAQSQLATFDLQAATIAKLTPAILDYAVAEKGAAVTTEDLKGLTNGLAQALNGNFASLTRVGFVLDDTTKELIANGTEAERAAALVEVLNSTYEGFNATAKETGQGGIVALTNELGRLGEGIGESVLPAFNELTGAITGALSTLVDFVEQNPKTTAAIAGIALAVTGLIGLIGSLGIAFIAFTKITAAATLALAPFGVTLGAIMLPALAVVGVLGSLAIAVALVADSFSETQDVFNSGKQAIVDAGQSFANAEAGITSYDSTIRDLNASLVASQDELLELGKKANAVGSQIADAIKESEERQKGYKMDKAELFVEQEQKIADLEKSLVAEKKSLRKADSDDEKSKIREKIDVLREQLVQEQEALANAAVLKTTLTAEIAEAQRFANLTEFEQKLETIAMQELAEQQRLEKRLAQLGAEAGAIAAQQAEIQARVIETQAAITDAEKKASEERIRASFAEAKAVINSEMMKASIRGKSTEKYTKALKELSQREQEAVKGLNDSGFELTANQQSSMNYVNDTVGQTADIGKLETAGMAWKAYANGVNSVLDKITFGAFTGGNKSVNDAIISPSGEIITTNPKDYLIATTNPKGLVGGGGIVININGTFMDDRAAARRMATEVMTVLSKNGRLPA